MNTSLITGASSGIGMAFANELASRKNNLVLVARTEEKLKQLAQKIREEHKVKVEIIVKDLTVSTAAFDIFNAMIEKNISIDTLINNAGLGDYGLFSTSERIKQLEMIQLNVTALVDLTYQFLPQMIQRGRGNIINISSIAAFQGLPYMAVYAATKCFVLSFSEALWAENSKAGVKVLAVCPGPTKTQFYENASFERFSNEAESSRLDSPLEVVREALNALDSGVSHVVTGRWENKIISGIPRFLPRESWSKILEQEFRPNIL
ncbi:SDR family NAD(P)-dependent oxidoreductase [Nostoc sp. MG11]|uniref:SDR family NAD(P)-dependent oxidoreductase n=1 Tax=Nostoc sp. MG11 TaxID=2721166 RepID=UPI0018696016|nr:SDR family oxidoreductase [Nostoc sp. MG11]